MSTYSEQLAESNAKHGQAYATSAEAVSGLRDAALRNYISENVGKLVKQLNDIELGEDKDGKPYGFWEHQKEAIRDLHAHIADKNKDLASITIIPTGGGKTEIFSHVIHSLAKPIARSEPKRSITPRTLIIEPTKQLVEQTSARIKKQFPDLQVGIYNGTTKDVQQITVITYASFMDLVEKEQLTPDDIDVMVMDEAHRGLSDDRQETFKQFKNKAAIFAFTASPAFDAMKNVQTLLGEDNVTYKKATVARLVKDKVLAPIANYLLRVKVDGDLPENEKERADLLAKLRADAVYEFYRGHIEEGTGVRLAGKRFLGYTADVDAADIAVDVFNKRLAADTAKDAAFKSLIGTYLSYTQQISNRIFRKAQRAAIQNLANEKPDDKNKVLGLFNAELLVEGTDIPNINAILNISNTSSVVKALQRGGRGARINPALDVDSPEQQCFVVDAFVEHNGKILGNPVFYYEAIQDDSVIKGIGTKTVRLPKEKKQKDIIEGVPIDGEPIGGNDEPTTPAPIEVPSNISVSYDVTDVKRMVAASRDGGVIQNGLESGYLTLSDGVPKAMFKAVDHPVYLKWRNEVEGKLDGGQEVEVNGHKIEKIRSGTRTAYALHEDAVPVLAREFGFSLEKKGLETKIPAIHLTIATELPKAMDVAVDNEDYMKWRKVVEEQLDAGKEVKIGDYPIIQMKSGRRHTPYCVLEDAVPVLAKELGFSLEKKDLRTKIKGVDLAILSELPAKIPLNPYKHPKWIGWIQEIQERLNTGEEVEVGGYPIIKMKSKAHTPWCIHIDAVPAVRAAVEAFGKAEDTAQGSSWVDRVGGPKDTTPLGSHTQNREGWKRDTSDE